MSLVPRSQDNLVQADGLFCASVGHPRTGFRSHQADVPRTLYRIACARSDEERDVALKLSGRRFLKRIAGQARNDGLPPRKMQMRTAALN